MPRQLPWKINGTSGVLDDNRPAKRQRVSIGEALFPTVSSSSSSSIKASRSIKQELKPEDSDDAGIIEDIEYMIDGISNDDRYIIIEDEFLRVARSFTSDLHSAEYERLLNLASLKDKTGHHIDSRTTLPAITKFKKEQLLKRQAIANNASSHPPAPQELDSDEEWERQMKANDELAHVGSSLSQLMRTGAKRLEERNLAALCAARGAGTRAAAGYKQGAAVKNGIGSPTKPKIQPTVKQTTKTTIQKSSKPSASLLDNDDTTSEEEGEEDLDNLVTKPLSIALRKVTEPALKPSLNTSKKSYNPSSSAPLPIMKYVPTTKAPVKAVSFNPSSRPKPKSYQTNIDSDEDADMSEGEAERWRRRRQAQ